MCELALSFFTLRTLKNKNMDLIVIIFLICMIIFFADLYIMFQDRKEIDKEIKKKKFKKYKNEI